MCCSCNQGYTIYTYHYHPIIPLSHIDNPNHHRTCGSQCCPRHLKTHLFFGRLRASFHRSPKMHCGGATMEEAKSPRDDGPDSRWGFQSSLRSLNPPNLSGLDWRSLVKSWLNLKKKVENSNSVEENCLQCELCSLDHVQIHKMPQDWRNDGE